MSSLSTGPAKEAYARVCEIVESVSGVGVNDLSEETNLLDLGLDSLMFVRIGRVLESTYSVDISMKTFYDELSVLGPLAEFLSSHGSVAAEAPQEPKESVEQASETVVSEVPVITQERESRAIETPRPASRPFAASAGADVNTVMSAHMQLMRTYLSGMAGTASGDASLGETLAGESRPAPQAEARLPSGKIDPDAAHRDAMEVRAKFSGIELSRETLSSQQRQFIDELAARFAARFPSSKAQAQAGREHLADWKYSLQFKSDLKELRFPIVCERAEGARFSDIDGNEFVDITMGMGVHYFGHSPEFINAAVRAQIDRSSALGPQAERATRVAQKLCAMTGHDRAALFVTGSDAVMLALRIVRAARRRNKVVIFGGAYHGICSEVLAAQGEHGSIVMSPGIPPQTVEDIVVLDYDAPESLQRIEAMADELAAVMVEPVQSRNPALQPQRFLRQLRALCTEKGVPLIFDEMVNGFRQAPGGMQEWFGVKSDMSTYGKIIGGGYPLSVVSGTAELMQWIDGGQWHYGDDSAPLTDSISTGGTHNKHPIALAAAEAVLDHLKDNPQLAGAVRARMHRLADRINVYFERESVPLRLTYCGTQFKFESFASGFEYELFFYLLTERGIYSWELHVANLSTAHSERDCDALVAAIKDSVSEMRSRGFEFRAAQLRGQYVPMSSVQRRIYALTQREGGEKPYHLCGVWRLEGRVDASRLEDSLHQVICRHESLRTAFVVVDGEFYQRVVKEPRFFLAEFDLAGRTPSEALEDFTAPFDLLEPPLLRAALAYGEDGTANLLIDVHHIAADGLSMNIVLQEALALYDGEALPPARVQARHVQVELDDYLASERGRADADYWRALVAPLDHPLDYPLDFARPAYNSFRGERLTARIDRDLTKSLHDFAIGSRASSFGVLLAAFAVWIARYARQQEFLIGLPAAGRPGTESDGAVGMFVNTMLFPARIDTSGSVANLVRQTRDQLFECQEHADYPFSALLETLDVKPSANRNPLFDIMFSYENAGEREIRTRDFRGETLEQFEGAGMFDISFDLIEAEGEVLVNCAFATDLLASATMRDRLAAYVDIVRALVSDPDAGIGGLLSPAKTMPARTPPSLAVAAVGAPASAGQAREEVSAQQTLIDLWQGVCARSPEHLALCDGHSSLSAKQVESRVRDAAFTLFNLFGVRRGDRVIVGVDSTVELPLLALAIMSMGAVYVPVSHDLPPARVCSIARQCGAGWIVTRRQDLAALTDEECVECVSPDELLSSELPQIRRQELPIPAPSDSAYILFTSGSTGEPKGVEVSHAGIANALRWRIDACGFSADDINLQMPSCAFDASILDMFTVLLAGGCLVMLEAESKSSLDRVAAVIEELGVTSILLTPSLYGLYLSRVSSSLQSLRLVTVAGEALTPSLVESHFASLPRVALWNEYGPTECSVVTIATQILSASDEVTIGVPIDNVRAYVLGDDEKQCPVGVWGKLWIAGISLAKGYVGKPELSDEKFRALPAVDEARAYETGDIVRLRSDGRFEYRGRADQQVKLHGYRIELGELESALLTLDGVRQSAADLRTRGDASNLYGWVVADALPTNWRERLLARLPRYMIPVSVQTIDALPLSTSGKLERARLPEHSLASERASEGSLTETDSPALAALMSQCRSVLRRETLTPNDHYFESGGDSIQAILLVSKLLEAGYQLDLNEFFRTPILAQLAAKMRAKDGAEDVPTALQTPPPGGLLTPIQRRFFETVKQDRRAFTQAVLFAVPASWSASTLEQLLAHWVAQHPELRRRWDFANERQLDSDAPNPFAFCVAESVADSESDGVAQAVRDTVDPENGPLVAARFWPEDSRLLIAAHHLVVDALSWQCLQEELSMWAVELAHGRALPAQGEAASLGHYAAALNSDESRRRAEGEREFWQQMLPTDATVPLVGERASASATLGNDIADALIARGHRLFRTRGGELLLAAFVDASLRTSKSSQLCLQMESHGRSSAYAAGDFSRTVGWMTSAYPLRFAQASALDWSEKIARIRDVTQRVPEQGVGFGVLREFSREPSLLAAPLPQIAFNYLGRLDSASDAEAFGILDEASGDSRNARLAFTPGIELTAFADATGLHLKLAMDAAFGDEAAVQSLMAATVESMTALAQATETMPRLVTPTPVDFVDSSWSHDEFEAFVARQGLARGAIENVAPLSPLQTGLVFHARSAPKDLAYLEQVDFQVDGATAQQLALAFQRLLDQHAALRVDFRAGGVGEYVQVVHASLQLPLEKHDLSRLSESDRHAEIRRRVEADRLVQFDVGSAPLMRVQLLDLVGDADEAARVHVIWTHHHLLMDGWCVGILVEDLLQHIEDIKSERAAAPTLPFDRSGYFAWLGQRDRVATAEYWHSALASFDSKTSLPATGVAAGDSEYAPGQLSYTLSPELVEALRAWSAAHSATLSSALRVLWGTLLARFVNKEAVTFGTIVSGRPAELSGIQEAVGLFINTLPARFQLDATMTASAALKLQRDQANSDRAHDYLPLAEIQKAADSDALFDHLLVLENYPMDESLRGAGAEQSVAAAAQPRLSKIGAFERTDYPLSVVAVPKDGLELSFLFDLRVYSDAFMQQVAEHLEVLARAMVAAPDSPLSKIDLLTEEQRDWLQGEWNATQANYPSEATLISLVDEQCQRRGEAQAVTSADADLSYAELKTLSEEIATAILEAGSAAQGDTIAIALPRGAQLVAAMLGVLRAGCAYTVLDPSQPPDRQRFICEDAGVPLLLSSRAVQPPQFDIPVLMLEDAPEASSDLPRVAPDAIAYVIYTSGSTGEPKGCQISHRNAVRLLRNERFDFDFHERDVWVAAHSFAFDFSVWETFGALTTGGRLVVARAEQVRDVSEFVALVVREGVSVLNQTPAAFGRFADWTVAKSVELPALRMVIFGGDKLQPARLAAWAQRVPLSRVRLINMYGITETTVHVTVHELSEAEIAGQLGAASLVGRPLPETTVWIVDRFDNLQPPNIPGEILVGGSGVCQGYLNRPALTAQRFGELTDQALGRVYRSGDVGVIRPGLGLEYLGREDGQVQVRGYRIELAEIERCFLTHQSVQQVAIVPTDEDGTTALNAFLVGDRSGAPGQWQDYFSSRLPSYMLPAQILWLDALPMTSNAKVDARALLALLPRRSKADAADAAAGPLEAALRDCWAEVLGTTRFTAHDSFFAVGGHSLKAVALAEMVQRACELELSIGEIFERPVFADMLALLEARKPDAPNSAQQDPLESLVDAVGVDALEELLNQLDAGEA